MSKRLSLALARSHRSLERRCVLAPNPRENKSIRWFYVVAPAIGCVKGRDAVHIPVVRALALFIPYGAAHDSPAAESLTMFRRIQCFEKICGIMER